MKTTLLIMRPNAPNATKEVDMVRYPSYDALIHPLLKNPDPTNVAPENLHTSMPRDRPFLYGEFKAQSTARIMPGQVKTADAPAGT